MQHKSMERGLKNLYFDKVLELGAGKSNHIRFVSHEYSEYHETDISFQALYQRDNNSKVKQFTIDATNLNHIQEKNYDRIIVSCLLIHLDEIESALSQWMRILTQGGILTILIPCEPGLFLRAARVFSTKQKTIRLGVDYLSIHYREHKTYFLRVKHYIDELSAAAEVDWNYYPFSVPSWNLNLWSVAQIRKK